MFHRVKYLIMVALFYLFRIFPIVSNKIVVSSFAGKGYGDNAKAIVDELLKQDQSYDIVWLCKNPKEQFPHGVRKVRSVSIKAVYELVTAKIWIDNRRKPGYVRKRNKQYFIATNHGNAGLKRVEFDAASVLPLSYLVAAQNDSKMTDLVISGSKVDTEIMRSAYLYTCEIMEIGLPRQDVLLRGDSVKETEIREKLGIKSDSKIVLYAPTFRRQMQETDLSVYMLDWTRVVATLKDRLGGDWVGIVRLHPNISAMGSSLNIPNSVINATDYPDMEELMLICDVLITDYSSTIIEAGIAEKIGFFFAVDLEEYKNDRDFYIPLEEFPFPLSESNQQLISAIENYHADTYYTRLHDFFQNKYGLTTTGHASVVIADKIGSLIAQIKKK